MCTEEVKYGVRLDDIESEAFGVGKRVMHCVRRCFNIALKKVIKALQDEADGTNVDEHHVKVVEFADVLRGSLEYKITATELLGHTVERIG